MPTLRNITGEDVDFVNRIKKIVTDEFYLAEAEEVVAQEEDELESESTFFSADIYRKENIKKCLTEEKDRLLETRKDIDKEKELLKDSVNLSEREVRTLAIRAMTRTAPKINLSQAMNSKRRKVSY